MRATKLILAMTLFFLFFQIPAGCCEPEEELSQLYGVVYEVDENIIRSIGFARVAIYENDMMIYSSWTRNNGTYSFMLKPGMYTITVEKTKYISQNAFVTLEPNATLKVDFPLESKVPAISPYEVLIIIKGFPGDFYPDMYVDGLFKGHALNNSKIIFEGGTFHTLELSEITIGDAKYILKRPFAYVASSNTRALFQYTHQFKIASDTNPEIEGWHDEGEIIRLEAREVIVIDISTRLVFNGWTKDGQILKQNPLIQKVDGSFNINSTYKKQYLLTVNTEMGSAEGGGWYDEDTLAKISIKEKEVGALPFKYRFIGWSGDLESKDNNVTILMDGPKEVSTEWERVQSIGITEPEPIYRAIISIGLLIVAAKILGGLFSKIDLPEVLGELFAGMILGPFALGSLEIFGGPLIELNEYVLFFAEIGAILLLFIAGLQISFGQFKAVGFKSVIVGTFGVVIPFFSGLYVMQLLGFPWEINLLVAATLTATSIAITLRTLESFGRVNSIEGNIMINSAVIDDVLGLVVLAVVISIVTSGSAPLLQDITWILFRTVAFWLILLIIVLAVAPKFVGVAERWETRGIVEAFSTATCFGSAVAAIVIGLSPIVGAFAAGMALAGSKVIVRVRDYIEKLSMLFSPIFFAVIGAQFNILSLNINSVLVALILLFVAVVSKLVGCGLPAMVLLRDIKKGYRVGLGMVSRGEVGLIIVGIGVTSGILTQNIYGAVVTMVILTTILTPIALKWSYSKEREIIKNSED